MATCRFPSSRRPEDRRSLGALTQPLKPCGRSKGAVVGRNLWGHGDTTMAARAFKRVIHDGWPQDALAAAGREP